MPDVLTHLIIGTSIALLARRDGPRSDQVLIVLGSVLIDIERPLTWVLTVSPFYWIGISSAFHSILGALVLSYVGAAFFNLEMTPFRNRMKLILIGSLSHLFLDMVMYPWAELGIYLLYPLKVGFSFNLLWPDFWWFPIIGLSCCVAAIIIKYSLKLSKIQ